MVTPTQQGVGVLYCVFWSATVDVASRKTKEGTRSPGRQGKLLHQPKLTFVEDGVMNGNSYKLVFKDQGFYILAILVAVLLALLMVP
jgi:hypothetical protein